MTGIVGNINDEFLAWEKRTRGYQLWEHPVELEPPYRPFQPIDQEPQVIDDGRRPGLFESWFSPPPAAPAPCAKPPEEPRPRRVLESRELAEIQLVLPEQFVVTPTSAQEFLAHVAIGPSPVSFELIGFHEGIVVQMCCAASQHAAVAAHVRAFYPEVQIRQNSTFLWNAWHDHANWISQADFGLSECCFWPLRQEFRRDVDPLTGVVGALADLEEGELAVLQVLVSPARYPWGHEMEQIFRKSAARDGASLLRAKFSEDLYATVLRVACLSPTSGMAFERVKRVGKALIAATGSAQNVLLALSNEGYDNELHAEDLLLRRTHRSGMLLNRSELLTLVHLPGESVRTDRLIRQSTQTKAAPEIVDGNPLHLGGNEHEGVTRDVTLSTEQRVRHTYIIGASGTGKSTLLLRMISQDLDQGNGIAVLDPHGDLIDEVLRRIPSNRIDEVALFDPADLEYAFAFNVLHAHSALEKTLLSSDLVAIFRRLATSWGDQMNSVFANAILAFLESSTGGTLLDLRRFLVDAAFRKEFLGTVADEEVRYFWTKEFPLLKGQPQAPILTRLDAFLRPKLVREVVAQRENKLDFASLMQNRRILLAKLAQGAIGQENSYLLGSFLVAKLHQIALSRQEHEASARSPFYLYIDEFQHFLTPSMASLFSGARKFSLGLTVCHQDLNQLWQRDRETASAVLSNAYTRIIFRVGDEDATRLAQGLSYFEPEDLLNLGVGEAIARVERASFDFNLKVPYPADVDPILAKSRVERIVAQSRLKFATDRLKLTPIRTDITSSEAPSKEPSQFTSETAKKPQLAPTSIVPAASTHSAATQAPMPGRGGSQHKYIQTLVKRFGEDRGYRVTIERQVLDGAGHVDVAFERDGLSIGCEISVTTGFEHEIQNLQKCIAAGFDHAVLISSDKKLLASANSAAAEVFGEVELSRLRFVTPEGLVAFLDEVEANRSAETKNVRGYKVNVRYRAVSEEDKKAKEALLSEVISKSLRRLRTKSGKA